MRKKQVTFQLVLEGCVEFQEIEMKGRPTQVELKKTTTKKQQHKNPGKHIK